MKGEHSCSTAHRVEGLKHETMLGLAAVLLLDDGALGVYSGLDTAGLGATASRPMKVRCENVLYIWTPGQQGVVQVCRRNS